MGPTFIINIAERPTSVTRLLTDDTMIYLAVKNKEDATLLQSDLDLLGKLMDDGVEMDDGVPSQLVLGDHHNPKTNTCCLFVHPS